MMNIGLDIDDTITCDPNLYALLCRGVLQEGALAPDRKPGWVQSRLHYPTNLIRGVLTECIPFII